VRDQEQFAHSHSKSVRIPVKQNLAPLFSVPNFAILSEERTRKRVWLSVPRGTETSAQPLIRSGTSSERRRVSGADQAAVLPSEGEFLASPPCQPPLFLSFPESRNQESRKGGWREAQDCECPSERARTA
jgi:hypothetical protein